MPSQKTSGVGIFIAAVILGFIVFACLYWIFDDSLKDARTYGITVFAASLVGPVFNWIALKRNRKKTPDRN